MATPTTNLRLLKPTNIEQYDLQTMNANLDSIDEAFGRLGVDRRFDTALSVGDTVLPTTHADYTPNLYRAARYGNWCYLRLVFDLDTANTVDGFGITNCPSPGQLHPDWWPLVASPLSTLFSGRGVEAWVGTNGAINITHATGTTNFAIGNTIDLAGWYMLADGI